VTSLAVTSLEVKQVALKSQPPIYDCREVTASGMEDAESQ